MKQVAISTWQGRVSPVFDTTRKIIVVLVKDGREMSRSEEILIKHLPPLRIQRLVDLEVKVLICGAISRPLSEMCSSAGIKIIPWVSGTIDEVLMAFFGGNLPNPEHTMPGCCRPRMRSGRGTTGSRRGEGRGGSNRALWTQRFQGSFCWQSSGCGRSFRNST